ncbi:MAG: sulfurase [Pseudomonadota bacterium]
MDNQTGTLIGIYTAPSSGRPLREQAEGRLVAGQGLEGDRYFGRPGGVISLIETEAIERFNLDHGTGVTAPETRRCLLTQGVALNPLVGKTFWINGIELEGMELCDPCAKLGQDLETETVSAAAVVRGFRVSGGLRAYVRGSGDIAPGDAITLSTE